MFPNCCMQKSAFKTFLSHIDLAGGSLKEVQRLTAKTIFKIIYFDNNW